MNSSDTSLRRTDNTRVHTLEATTSRHELLGTSVCWEFCQEVPERRAGKPVHRPSSTTLEGHTRSATHNKNRQRQEAGNCILNKVEAEFCSPAAPGGGCFAPLLRLWPHSSSVTGVVCAFCARFRARQWCKGSGEERCGGGSHLQLKVTLRGPLTGVTLCERHHPGGGMQPVVGGGGRGGR